MTEARLWVFGTLLAGAILIATLLLLFGDGTSTRATIAGTTVPAVHCQEDEVISWTGIDTLGCVHHEDIN